jgi:hypothetical protein
MSGLREHLNTIEQDGTQTYTLPQFRVAMDLLRASEAQCKLLESEIAQSSRWKAPHSKFWKDLIPAWSPILSRPIELFVEERIRGLEVSLRESEAREEQVTRAFLAFVRDMHAHKPEENNPSVLGLCANCGFPVCESEHGGLDHYAFSTKECCGYPALATPSRGVLRETDRQGHVSILEMLEADAYAFAKKVVEYFGYEDIPEMSASDLEIRGMALDLIDSIDARRANAASPQPTTECA